MPGESSEAKRVLSGGFAKALSAELRPPERAGGREQCIEYSQKSRRWLAGWLAGARRGVGAALSGTHCAPRKEGRSVAHPRVTEAAATPRRRRRRRRRRRWTRAPRLPALRSPSRPSHQAAQIVHAPVRPTPIVPQRMHCITLQPAASAVIHRWPQGSEVTHHHRWAVSAAKHRAGGRRLASFWYYSTVSTHSWRPFDT